ncbi:polymer-forming cytoskeletal protein [Candidatus Saganbacteria bacterium]|nr:polymer-forming cytoskeletal protein [Candidatus Saganbacteria bacterium]
MKFFFGCFLALIFLLLVVNPCFAVLSALKNDNHADLIEINNDIIVPAGSHVNSAVAVRGSVTVNGSVAKDVVAVGGSVRLKDKALVNGDVVAIGGQVTKDPGAMVTGSISEIALPGGFLQLEGLTKVSLIKGMIFFDLLVFIGFLALAMILVALFTSQLGVVSATTEKRLLASFLWGLLAVILIVPVIIVLIVSLVGIILIPVWVILALVALIFGYVGAAHLVGKKALYAFKVKGSSMMLETICGIVVIYLVCLVPIIGCILKALIGTVGLGSVVITRFGTQRG